MHFEKWLFLMHIIKSDYKNILKKPSQNSNCSRPGAGSTPVPWICTHKSSLIPNPGQRETGGLHDT